MIKLAIKFDTCLVQYYNYLQTVANIFKGYNEVGVIPRGASSILIQQNGYNGRKNDDNYLGNKIT